MSINEQQTNSDWLVWFFLCHHWNSEDSEGYFFLGIPFTWVFTKKIGAQLLPAWFWYKMTLISRVWFYLTRSAVRHRNYQLSWRGLQQSLSTRRHRALRLPPSCSTRSFCKSTRPRLPSQGLGGRSEIFWKVKLIGPCWASWGRAALRWPHARNYILPTCLGTPLARSCP